MTAEQIPSRLSALHQLCPQACHVFALSSDLQQYRPLLTLAGHSKLLWLTMIAVKTRPTTNETVQPGNVQDAGGNAAASAGGKIRADAPAEAPDLAAADADARSPPRSPGELQQNSSATRVLTACVSLSTHIVHPVQIIKTECVLRMLVSRRDITRKR